MGCILVNYAAFDFNMGCILVNYAAFDCNMGCILVNYAAFDCNMGCILVYFPISRVKNEKFKHNHSPPPRPQNYSNICIAY